MAWEGLIEQMDTLCLQTFSIGATLHPQSGNPDVAFTGIVQTPAMAEDYVPGGTQGTTVVRFFVRFVDLSPLPQKGDTVTVNGVLYDVFEVDVDVEGGAILKLRRNA